MKGGSDSAERKNGEMDNFKKAFIRTATWNDGMSREAVLEHYGYEDIQEPHVAMGFWTKGSVPGRIENLSDALTKVLDFKKRIRVIFEYDPDFPRAYLRIEGTKEVNVK